MNINSGLVNSSELRGRLSPSGNLGVNSARPLSEDYQAIAEKDGFVDVMGDKNDRHPELLPEIEQHLLHLAG